MSDIIKNTESQALFDYCKLMNGFMQSLTVSTQQVVKNANDLTHDWKGDQARQFLEFVDEFRKDMQKNLQSFEQLRNAVFNKARELNAIENKKLGGH